MAGLTYMPPLRFGALRALVAAAALLVLLILTGRPLVPPRRLWAGVFAIGATGTLLAYAAMFSAPGYTGAGIASVLGNTTPLLTLVLAVPLLGERLTRPKLAALLLGLSGVGLVAIPTLTNGARGSWTGPLLPLGAAAGFAMSSIVVKRIDARGAELQVAAWQLLLGGAALAGVSAILEPETAGHWTVRFAGLLLFLSLIGTGVTTVVWYWLVQRDDVGTLSITLFAVPVVGLVLGTIWFNERLEAVQLPGVALILGALAILTLGGHPSQRRA